MSSGEGHDWVKDPKTLGLWESGRAFPLDLPVDADSMCRKRLPHLSSPGYLRPEDYAVTEAASTEISSTCVLGPAVYHKPCLPVYLYILTTSPCLAICNNPPPCSTLHNKHTEFLDDCGFSAI